MSSFFHVPPPQKKRPRTEPGGPPAKRAALQKRGRAEKQDAPKPLRKPDRDEEISGSESEDDDGPRSRDDEEELSDASSDAGEETAAERRLKLAERYLENIKKEVDGAMEIGFDAEEIDRDLIAERLQEDVAESKGRAYRNLAEELDFGAAARTVFKKNDTQAITSIATCTPYVYTVSKDMWLIKWRLQDPPSAQYPSKPGKKKSKKLAPPRRQPERLASVRGDKTKSKDSKYQGHSGSILTVAASQDGNFVATGGADNKIIVWNTTTLKPLRVFNQHRDSVTSLSFRRGTNQLYSSSKDRTIKIWSLNELAYIETLFGHQDEVVDIAALAREHCVSVGARDRTARFWKVAEETQLVFRGGEGEKKRHSNRPHVQRGSLDCVAMVDEETFVTGSDNGDISLWAIHKKKPIHTYSLAHGIDPPMRLDEVSADANPSRPLPDPQPRWITALTTIPYSDIILSGSWDGQLRAWKVSTDKKKIEPLGVVGSLPIVLNGLNGTHMPEVETEVERDISSPSIGFPLLNITKEEKEPLAKGVINAISVFEREESFGIAVAVGKEHRLGNWTKTKGGKNTAMLFDVPKFKKQNTAAAVGDEEQI